MLVHPLLVMFAVSDISYCCSSFRPGHDGHAVELKVVGICAIRFTKGPNVGMQAEMMPPEHSTVDVIRPPISLS